VTIGQSSKGRLIVLVHTDREVVRIISARRATPRERRVYGIPGVALGIVVVIVTGFVCIVADRLLGGSGIAGAAASSTAGNSAAVPQAIALADPTYTAIAPTATIQVAASVIVTAVLTPILTTWWFRRGRVASTGRPADRGNGQ
jgi:hypothetical protein